MSASTLINSFGKSYTYRRYDASVRDHGRIKTRGDESFLPLVDQVQVLTFQSLIDSGTMKLSFDGEETADIDYGADIDEFVANINTEFNLLSNVDGACEATAAVVDGKAQITFTFGRALGQQPLAEVLVSEDLLFLGSVAVGVFSSTVTLGVAANTRRKAVMSIQPMSDYERQMLPEGMRQREARKVYTVEELRLADTVTGFERGDRIEIPIGSTNRRFEVVKRMTEPSETDLSHFRYGAVLVEDDADGDKGV